MSKNEHFFVARIRELKTLREETFNTELYPFFYRSEESTDGLQESSVEGENL